MNREQSLDALRGFAILTMVLSGSIAFGGVLPAWMYHAQVPPPLHKFDPSIPGITWVDLVFPFFLFSMGAAIPLSLSKYKSSNASFPIFWIALRRFILLTFFALFIYHMRAWVIDESPEATEHLLSILAFVLLHFMFIQIGNNNTRKILLPLKIVSFMAAVTLLFLLPFNAGKGFQLDKVDIIILVLGNMAFFGTIIYWFTRTNTLARLALLPLVAAIFLARDVEGSINQMVFDFSPLPWMYKFYYLKYLFIIIPGTMAGDWLLQEGKRDQNDRVEVGIIPVLISMSLIIVNLVFLFSRELLTNLAVTVILLLVLRLLLALRFDKDQTVRKFFRLGAYLLLLGLLLEAYEGGIRKDSSTYSYYFVTSGLAFFALIALRGLSDINAGRSVSNYFAANGRNPMVAYVAGNLLLLPLLYLTGTQTYLDSLNANPWLGFLRGLLFTGVVSLITLFFVNRKWFWKT